ncbi:MAG: hypothetical protein H6Q42_1866, partial [Deltaproteobacteria bacterium]|nr:hypothetical protein [Deltaproteobacteria bacterium]
FFEGDRGRKVLVHEGEYKERKRACQEKIMSPHAIFFAKTKTKSEGASKRKLKNLTPERTDVNLIFLMTINF